MQTPEGVPQRLNRRQALFTRGCTPPAPVESFEILESPGDELRLSVSLHDEIVVGPALDVKSIPLARIP